MKFVLANILRPGHYWDSRRGAWVSALNGSYTVYQTHEGARKAGAKLSTLYSVKIVPASEALA